MKSIFNIFDIFDRSMLSALASVALLVTACGGGGGGDDGGGGGITTTTSPSGGTSTTLSTVTTTTLPGVNAADVDGDGIPNTEDAFPNDPALFASFGTPAPTLGTLGTGTFSVPRSINGSGLIVGFANSDPGPAAPFHAAVWTVSGQGVTTGAASALLELPGAPGGSGSAANGVNDAGRIVGFSDKLQGGATVQVPVLWMGTGAAPIELPRLGGVDTFGSAFDIANPDGAGVSRVVGESENNQFEKRAVIWQVNATGAVVSGPVELINSLGGVFSSALSVNDDGMIAGEAEDLSGVLHAVLWRPAAGGGIEMVDLGAAQDTSSSAVSINSSGQVVGEAEPVAGEIHGILWTIAAGGVTRLDLGPNTAGSAFLGPNRVIGSKSAGVIARAVVWDIRSTALPPDPDDVVTGESLTMAMGPSGQVVGMRGNLLSGSGFVATPN